jgi:hypothetical protein
VLLALVRAAVLPDATYGPYAVFNPREMWLMAVLIVGLSLCGYIALKFFGERAGIVAGGLLGGLISSTATTVSWSRLTRDRPETARAAALVSSSLPPWSTGACSPRSRRWRPRSCRRRRRPSSRWAAAMAVSAAVPLAAHAAARRRSSADGQQPASLKTAFTFAALYGIVLLAVAVVNDRFGARGLYAVSTISGLTDVDAITLSVARLVAPARSRRTWARASWSWESSRTSRSRERWRAARRPPPAHVRRDRVRASSWRWARSCCCCGSSPWAVRASRTSHYLLALSTGHA